MNILKILAVMVICLVVANIILYTIGRLSTLLFWIIIIVAAIIAYWIMPRLRKNTAAEIKQE